MGRQLRKLPGINLGKAIYRRLGKVWRIFKLGPLREGHSLIRVIGVTETGWDLIGTHWRIWGMGNLGLPFWGLSVGPGGYLYVFAPGILAGFRPNFPLGYKVWQAPLGI